MLVFVPFYKVIVISIDIFESNIIDERHFSNRPDAELFAEQSRHDNNIAVIVQV